MVVAVLGCGVLPAIASSRLDVANDLRIGGQAHGSGRIGGVREFLVVAQIAGSMVLLAGTALLVESLANLYAAEVGFDPARVLSLSIADTARSRPGEEATQIQRELAESVERLPGVEAVGFASLRPFSNSEIGLNVFADGVAPVHTLLNGITPRYFAAVGIPLTSGRTCAGDARAAPVQEVVINERLARQLFGRTNIEPRPIRSVEGERQFIVVGVVGDTVYGSVREAPRNLLYMCRVSAALSGTMFVRTIDGRADRLAPAVTRVVQDVARGVEVTNAQTLASYLRASFHVDRLVTTLLSVFTLLALGIALVGLYGVLAGMVLSRIREIGVRIALGAGRWQVAAVVARPAARLVVFGLLLGTIGALASAAALRTLLFQVSRADPSAYAWTMAVMVLTAALASYLPVRRAMEVDPVETLRID
jgi:predicted permease